jgi:hypothetical protein
VGFATSDFFAVWVHEHVQQFYSCYW